MIADKLRPKDIASIGKAARHSGRRFGKIKALVESGKLRSSTRGRSKRHPLLEISLSEVIFAVDYVES